MIILNGIINLIIIVLVFFLATMARILLPINEVAKERRYLELEDLKTGDVLAVSYRGFSGKMIHGLSGSNWHHAGIIYVDPKTNIQYVLEGTLDQRRKKFFSEIPLSKWITINRYSLVCVMKINGNLDPDLLYDKFRLFSKSYVVRFDHRWVRFMFTTPYKKYKSEDYHQTGFTCVEMVIKVLQETGVLSREHSESSFLLPSLLKSHIKMESSEYSYQKPFRISLGRPYVRGVINH